jgi:hypothetical protein
MLRGDLAAIGWGFARREYPPASHGRVVGVGRIWTPTDATAEACAELWVSAPTRFGRARLVALPPHLVERCRTAAHRRSVANLFAT